MQATAFGAQPQGGGLFGGLFSFCIFCIPGSILPSFLVDSYFRNDVFTHTGANKSGFAAFGFSAPASSGTLSSPGGGLFGAQPQQEQTAGTFGFGGQPQQQQQQTGLFGAEAAAATWTKPATAFATPAGDLFGGTAGGLGGFGAQQPAVPATEGLFGGGESPGGLFFGAAAPVSGGMFGAAAPASGGVFGAAPVPAPSGGGMVGSASAPLDGLFKATGASPAPVVVMKAVAVASAVSTPSTGASSVSHTWVALPDGTAGKLGLTVKQLGNTADEPAGVKLKDLKDPNMEKTLRAKGIKPGMLILDIGGTNVREMSYDAVMAVIKNAGRPLTITFGSAPDVGINKNVMTEQANGSVHGPGGARVVGLKIAPKTGSSNVGFPNGGSDFSISKL